MESARTKEIGVLVVAILATGVILLLIGATIIDPTALGSLPTVTALSILLWAAVYVCSALFLHGWQMGQYILASTSGVIAWSVSGFTIAGLIGGLLFATLLIAASSRVKQELNARIKFQPHRVLFRPLEMAFVALAIVAFLFSLPNLRESITSGGFGVPNEAIQTVLVPATPLISNLLPGYQPDATVDDLIRQQLQGQQLAGLPIEPQIPLARQEVSRTIGVELSGNETVAEIITKRINKGIQNVAEGGGPVLILVVGVIGLLAIRAIVPLITWPTLGLALGGIWIARKANLISIEQTQVTAEKLRIL